MGLRGFRKQKLRKSLLCSTIVALFFPSPSSPGPWSGGLNLVNLRTHTNHMGGPTFFCTLANALFLSPDTDNTYRQKLISSSRHMYVFMTSSGKKMQRNTVWKPFFFLLFWRPVCTCKQRLFIPCIHGLSLIEPIRQFVPIMPETANQGPRIFQKLAVPAVVGVTFSWKHAYWHTVTGNGFYGQLGQSPWHTVGLLVVNWAL
jgi:hypothetical protein